MLITGIVLNDQHGSAAVLLRSDSLCKISVVDVSPLDGANLVYAHLFFLCIQSEGEPPQKDAKIVLVFVIGAAPATSEILTSKKSCYNYCLYLTLLPQAWAAKLDCSWLRTPGISPLRGSLRAAPIV